MIATLAGFAAEVFVTGESCIAPHSLGGEVPRDEFDRQGLRIQGEPGRLHVGGRLVALQPAVVLEGVAIGSAGHTPGPFCHLDSATSDFEEPVENDCGRPHRIAAFEPAFS